MRHGPRIPTVLITLASAAILAVVPGAAATPGQTSGPFPPLVEQGGPGAMQQQPLDFGPNNQLTVIHAAAWSPYPGSQPFTIASTGGYVSFDTDGAWHSYWTQLDLPLGASIDLIRALVTDSDDESHWYFRFQAYGAYNGTTDPFQQDFASGETTDAFDDGYTEIMLDLDPPVVVHSFTDLDSDGLLEPSAYVLYLSGSQEYLGLAFWGAIVRWHRTVSPPPLTATFNDVPSGHWAFPFVEALAASGITAGCGGGNYCPDDPITRGQMAVYLSAALGLYWWN